MTITTNNLALTEPNNGSYTGTWDQPVNANSTILEYMHYYTLGVTISPSGTSGSATLCSAPSNSPPTPNTTISTSQVMRFNITGPQSANQTLKLPLNAAGSGSVAGMWIFSNNTLNSTSTGPSTFSVTISPASGAGTSITIPNSYSVLVYSDGTNVKYANDGSAVISGVGSFSAGTTGFTPSTASTGNVTLSGTLNVANGGTGAATLAANNVLLGNGTGALQVVAPGTSGNVLTSNGTTWTSAAASGGLGNTSQAYTSVVGSRALATTYTNSTASPIQVIITASISPATNFSLLASVNSGTAFTFGAATTNTFASGSFIVPPGQTYNVTSSPSTGVTVTSWVELR